jgi:uncharacterized repeat protein (TIGR03803 family)
MAGSPQYSNWKSKIHPGAASGALTLAIMLVLGLSIPSAQAQTFTDVYNFTGSPDGVYPYAGLIEDSQGNLYGTTAYGGAYGYGTVFKVAGGAETVIYSFTGETDGSEPYSPLLLDGAGNIYGATYSGGASGFGTVFKLDASENETVVYSFAGGTTDGCHPTGSLLLDSSGNLYGTTESCGAHNFGTVFEINSSGTETLLHSFAGGSSDGANPSFAGLVMGPKGNLYGTTQNGGASSYGVLYKLAQSTESILYSFAGGMNDGCYPFGTPVMDKETNLYGTTLSCGSGSSGGIVWKVAQVGQKGKETVMHRFAGGKTDGCAPFAGVVLDASGNLYGTTFNCGASTFGTVFKVTSKGKESLLHSFGGNSAGAQPYSSVIVESSGNLYGTTLYGGSQSACQFGCGTVWQLTP